MYSYEERMKAVQLYIKYGRRAAPVIHELGYPNRHMLVCWFKEYEETGTLKTKVNRNGKYTDEQKSAALKHYEEHGRCVTFTIKELGYPSPRLMRVWIDEAFPNRKKRCVTGGAMIEYPQEKKEQAVIDFCARSGSAEEVAELHEVSRYSLYKWKRQFLGKRNLSMPKKKINELVTNETLSDEVRSLTEQRNALARELDEMNQKLHRARIEHDILVAADEILKKDQGINPQNLKNCEKAELIDALRNKYRLKELLHIIGMSKSSYCYQCNVRKREDKYKGLRNFINQAFLENRQCYGYRRIHMLLRQQDIVVSEKVVRRIMKEEGLAIKVPRKKKYSSYMGEISPAVENLVQRNFHAEIPNSLWLTDITEFHIPAGKVYFSPIIDCFDGLPVAWTIGTSPDANLVNNMLDKAISTLKENEHPIVHSDRGAHYRWPGWISRMNEAGLQRSMSKKGYSPDNSACEGFFGHVKNEMFYNHSWSGTSIDSFIETLNDYMHWYCHKRIKLSLGGMSPINYRKSKGYFLEHTAERSTL